MDETQRRLALQGALIFVTVVVVAFAQPYVLPVSPDQPLLVAAKAVLIGVAYLGAWLVGRRLFR
jgi:hypothetical protein